MVVPGPEDVRRSVGPRARAALVAILLLSSWLRFHHLGRLSLWYDEVVTMRLARTADPAALVRLLDRIDATRAPLHPLLLQVWLKLWGPSDFAGRAFSALCGIATVALVFWIGRLAYDTATGLWGAWLAAWSPLLVQYSQEARTYAWLALVTCLSWGLLLSLRGSATRGMLGSYALVLAALVYSHPLGLLMAGALALGSLVNRSALGLSWAAWLTAHAAAGLVVGPWLPRYFDHPPEYLFGGLALRFLIGLPIGFIGGNRFTLPLVAGVIAFGLLGTSRGEDGRRRIVLNDSVASTCLLIWFAVPPLLLYVYSLVSYPVFGPARYTLFVGPAYLLLVARGLVRLPLPARMLLAGAGAAASASLLATLAYAPDAKTDWRAVAAYLDRHAPGAPVVLCGVAPADYPTLETARYYFGRDRRLIPAPGRCDAGPASAWLLVDLRRARPPGQLPESVRRAGREGRTVDLAGMRLVRPR